MPPFLVSLIGVLVPFLVSEAEKLFSRGNPNSGSLKHAWVTSFVTEIIEPELAKRLPDYLKPDAQALADAIDTAIEAALVAVGDAVTPTSV